MNQQDSYHREWALFADYCTAMGYPALPTTPAAVRGFFRQVSAAPATRQRRLLAISRAHREADCLFYQPPDPTQPERTEARLAAAAAMIAACPTRGWPVGLTGRRDAFLVVLLEVLGHTHRQVQRLTSDEVDAGDGTIRIRGRTVPESDDVRTCPRCAVARWLSVLDHPDPIGRSHAYTRIATARTPRPGDEHRHHPGDPTRWRAAPYLAAAIDQHGWINGKRPLSRSSIGTRLQQAHAQTPGSATARAHQDKPQRRSDHG
jgi:hypothetical protein